MGKLAASVVALLAIAVSPAQTLLQRIDGAGAGDNLGVTIAWVGDIDTDGVEDFAVGSHRASPGGITEAGRVQVFSGSDRALLYSFEGSTAFDWMGIDVGSAGDVNGDLVPDIVVGACQLNGTGPGYAQIRSGADGSLIRTYIGSVVGDAFGWAVAGIGDVDGDGRDDQVITAYYADTPNGQDSGGAHVFSGLTGNQLYALRGDGTTTFFGHQVAVLGDIDADTIADFAITQPWSSPGLVRVYSGADGAPLRTRLAGSAGERSYSVAGIGDVDADGVPDFACSTIEYPSGNGRGRVFAVSGATGLTIRSFDGPADGDWHHTVADAGDVDGDGQTDIAVGANQSSTGPGYARVYSVASGALLVEVRPDSALEIFGYSLIGGRDLDGDGVGELVVGAPWKDHGALIDAGSAYVFSVASRSVTDLTLFDGDGDGLLDAASADGANDRVSLRLGDGLGAFSPATEIALGLGGVGPRAVAAGDLDHDGDADDLAVACDGSASVAIVVDPAGTPLLTSMPTAGARPVCIAVGDLDGTGADDIVVGREGEVLTATGAGIAMSLGGAPFVDVAIPGGHPTRVVDVLLRDLDGDGDGDLVALARGAVDEVLLFAGDGAGSLAFVGSLALPAGGLTKGLCCGDMDGDSDLDLLVGASILLPVPGSTLRAFRFAASGPLDASQYAAVGDVATTGALIADLDCTERDVVVVHAGSGGAVTLRDFDLAMPSYGALETPTAGPNPSAVAIGDIDGNGLDDIVIADRNGRLAVTLRNPIARVVTLGTGCAGTGGLVPQLAALGLPTLGNAAFGVRLTDALANAPVLVGFGTDATTLPLAGGCAYHIGAVLGNVLRFADPSGEQEYPFGVPNDTNLLGFELVIQHAVFDPGGAFAQVLALSNGLVMEVGL